MSWLISYSSNTRTILSVMPSATPPRPENDTGNGNVTVLSTPAGEPAPNGRPVHWVNGRVASRRPDHTPRPRAVCPFRFRLAWWFTSTRPPKPFEELCENCEANRGKKLGRLLNGPYRILFSIDIIILLNHYNI